MVFEDISSISCLARVVYLNHQFCQCIRVSWNASRLSANSISLWIIWLCAYVCIASLVFDLLIFGSAFIAF
jgi:hypothetical protein